MAAAPDREAIAERGGHSFSLLWLDEDGKSWAAIVKRTSNDEAYLQSYQRARSRQVAAWTAQKEESGE